MPSGSLKWMAQISLGLTSSGSRLFALFAEELEVRAMVLHPNAVREQGGAPEVPEIWHIQLKRRICSTS